MRYSHLIFMIIENSRVQANSKYMIHQKRQADTHVINHNQLFPDSMIINAKHYFFKTEMENKAKTQNVDSNKFMETWSMSIGPGDKGDV